jgi:hypothetical protein
MYEWRIKRINALAVLYRSFSHNKHLNYGATSYKTGRKTKSLIFGKLITTKYPNNCLPDNKLYQERLLPILWQKKYLK